VAEVLSKALQGIQTANFEFPLITRPGTRIEILLNATPRNDSNGNIVGVVGIGQDITDRIAQEHEYFRLIDTANAPIFGVDTNGCINEWNQKIVEITGYPRASVLGLSLVNTFIIPESRQQVRQLLNQALIGIDVGEMELPMTTKHGAFLLLLVNASSKKDMHGNIRGVIGVGQDYTARKHMEQAKVNFLASFSHELRTPLNGVLGMLELLKEQKLDTQPERYVHMAYVSGSLLLNLINDILDLSKIEAGHLEISAAPFQMHELLDYSIEIFKFKARERGLKLEIKCDEQVPTVAIGDVVRLRQVLLNLLSNAIKFTNTGGISVSCSVVHAPDLPKAFKRLLFQVIDTGIGMDAEEKSRLFSLFTKLERTRQNNPTGSGLGLAICKQLAELMDGQIDVDSELGVGSNFYFTVVVRLLDDEGDPQNELYASDDYLIDGSTRMLTSGTTDGGSNVNSNESTGSLTSNGPSMLPPPIVIPKQARILVVEDNEFNWEVVKCFLQEDDHLLQWEVNGHEAVTAYIDHYVDFDLIFMDCEMPVMDGYTATAMIRQFEIDNHLPRIPILGLTAYAMSGDRQKCLEAGMDEFMVKPISKVSLLQAIRQWMRIRYLRLKNAKECAASPSGSSGNTPKSGTPTAGVLHKSRVLQNAAPASNPLVAPTPRNSFDGATTDETEPAPSRLAPASRHMQQLDLARAISNLELDDPMAIGRQGGRAFHTAPPSTSIFSLGSGSLFGTSTRSATTGSGLLNFQRDAGGAIVDVPDWKQISKTSTTLPYTKEPLFAGASPSETEQRSSYPKNPTLWSHPPFKKEPQPSPLSLAKSQLTGGFSGNGSLKKRDSEFSIASLLKSANSSTNGGGESQSYPPGLRRDHTEGDAASSSTMDPLGIPIPEGDPVNYSLGVDQCGGKEELFLNLLEKFALGCDSAMARILAASEKNDIILARREAHSLKGSSAYAAALRVSKSAFRVQIACDRLLESQGGTESFSPDAPADPKAKELVDESIALLRKEHRLLTGYLRRNFVFRGAPPPGSTTRQNSVGDRQERGSSQPCGVM
jgi:PAS domain S-box-containing protein